MRKLILIAALFALPACAHADSDDLPPVRTVNRVDVKKYLGRWYEIASFPQRFQKDCTASTADYSLREDGKLSVLNQCRIGSPDGKLKTAKGVAYAVDETYAKLRVSFFWPFYGY